METDHQTIKKLVHYDPTTGKITWLPRTIELYREAHPDYDDKKLAGKVGFFNSQYAGKEVYADRITGHVRISIKTDEFERIRDIRLIWWLVTGSKPTMDVIKKDPNKPNTPDNILQVSANVAAIFLNPNTGVFTTYNGYGYRIDVDGKRYKRTGFPSAKTAYNARVEKLKEFGLFFLEALSDYMDNSDGTTAESLPE